MQPPSVRKAVYWCDGGCEFVFSDGVVLAFGNEMQTMSFARSEGEVDFAVTHLCISRQRHYVSEALSIYNALSPHPYLKTEFIVNQKAIDSWKTGSPIDSSVVVADSSHFRKSPDGTATLTCALGHVSLVLHPHRRFFSVRWPAAVSKHGGFAPNSSVPMGAAFLFVDQVFPVASPPDEWVSMLRVALDFENSSATGGEPKTVVVRLPKLTSNTHSSVSASIRFPDLKIADVPAMVASSDLYMTHGSSSLHAANAFPVWHYACDVGGTPAIIWNLNTDDNQFVVEALALEDLSSITAEPVGPHFALTHRMINGSNASILFDTTTNAPALRPSSYGIGSLSDFTSFNDIVSQLRRDLMPVASRLMFPTRCPRIAHYLRDLATHSVRLSLFLKRRVADATAHEAFSSRNAVAPRTLKLSSRIDGLGSFSAFHDGSVRVQFDDRHIVTLSDSVAQGGLVAHILAPDASIHFFRVATCVPSNAYFQYVHCALEFRNFSTDSTAQAHQAVPLVAAHTTRHVISNTPSIPTVDLLLLQTREQLALAELSSRLSSSLIVPKSSLDK